MKNLNIQLIVVPLLVFAVISLSAQSNFHTFFVTGNNMGADVTAGPLVQLTDGEYVTFTYFDATHGGHGGYILAKIDDNSNMVWARRLSSGFHQNNHQDFDLAATGDGGFLFSGTQADMGFIIKFNSAGLVLWSGEYSSTNGKTRILDLFVDTDDIITVLGTSNTHLTLFRLYANGSQHLVSRELRTTSEEALHPVAIKKMAGGDFVLLANMAGNEKQVLIRLNSMLLPVWSRVISNPFLEFRTLDINSSDIVYLTGLQKLSSTDKSLSISQFDAETGLPVWTKKYESMQGMNQNMEIWSFTANANDMLAVSATSNDNTGSYATVKFIDSNGNFTAGTRIDKPVVNQLDKYTFSNGYMTPTASGNYMVSGAWHRDSDGNSGFYVKNIDGEGSINCNEAKFTMETLDFTFSPETIDSLDISVQQGKIRGKGSQVGMLSVNLKAMDGCEEDESKPAPVKSVSVGPNPNDGSFTVTFDSKVDQGRLRMIDLMGKEVYSRPIDESVHSVDIAVEVPKGIYFLEVTSGHGKNIEKIMVR